MIHIYIYIWYIWYIYDTYIYIWYIYIYDIYIYIYDIYIYDIYIYDIYMIYIYYLYTRYLQKLYHTVILGDGYHRMVLKNGKNAPVGWTLLSAGNQNHRRPWRYRRHHLVRRSDCRRENCCNSRQIPGFQLILKSWMVYGQWKIPIEWRITRGIPMTCWKPPYGSEIGQL